jgi:hypothetical protein
MTAVQLGSGPEIRFGVVSEIPGVELEPTVAMESWFTHILPLVGYSQLPESWPVLGKVGERVAAREIVYVFRPMSRLTIEQKQSLVHTTAMGSDVMVGYTAEKVGNSRLNNYIYFDLDVYQKLGGERVAAQLTRTMVFQVAFQLFVSSPGFSGDATLLDDTARERNELAPPFEVRLSNTLGQGMWRGVATRMAGLSEQLGVQPVYAVPNCGGAIECGQWQWGWYCDGSFCPGQGGQLVHPAPLATVKTANSVGRGRRSSLGVARI